MEAGCQTSSMWGWASCCTCLLVPHTNVVAARQWVWCCTLSNDIRIFPMCSIGDGARRRVIYQRCQRWSVFGCCCFQRCCHSILSSHHVALLELSGNFACFGAAVVLPVNIWPAVTSSIPSYPFLGLSEQNASYLSWWSGRR